jgi:hypothetical protein
MCEFQDLIVFPPKCQPLSWNSINTCNGDEEVFALLERNRVISYAQMSKAMKDKKYAHSISKYVVDNALEALPLADKYQGIIGMTPWEFLHMLGIGEKDSNARLKGQINDIFPDIRFAIGHNAERDFSRMSNRKGFFNASSLTNDEIRGNFFGYMIFLHTSYGRRMVKPCMMKRVLVLMI